jgi:cyanophycinase
MAGETTMTKPRGPARGRAAARQSRSARRPEQAGAAAVQPTYAPVEPKPAHDDHTRGTIVLIGGAEDRTGDRVVLREVASRAGQGTLVVATVATAHPQRAWRAYRRVFHDLGVRTIRHLHVPDRAVALGQKASELLADAKVVFFTGGDQVRITSVIGGTPLCDQIMRGFRRGATIAGTSAGASVMSEMMLVPGDRFESHTVRDSLAMAPGLGLVADMIIDQHFAARGRLSRLMGAVAQNPRALGVGVDEDTAFVIHHGHCQVVGAGAVYIVDANASSSSNLSEADADKTMSLFDVRLHVLSSTDTFDLKARRPGRRGPQLP